MESDVKINFREGSYAEIAKKKAGREETRTRGAQNTESTTSFTIIILSPVLIIFVILVDIFVVRTCFVRMKKSSELSQAKWVIKVGNRHFQDLIIYFSGVTKYFFSRLQDEYAPSFRYVWTEQNRKGRKGQDCEEQDRTGQNRTELNRTEQNRTKQDRTGQNRTEQDRRGQTKKGYKRQKKTKKDKER